MLEVGQSSIRYSSQDKDTIHFPIAVPDWSVLEKSISVLCLPDVSGTYSGYDAWQEQFPPGQELRLVKKAIQQAKKGKKIHIRGISLADSIELLGQYYEAQGYRDSLDRYHIPIAELLTVSISLRHFLWSDKDKKFLMTNGISNPTNHVRPYYAITPPLRTSHDLRQIQQAVRMGMIPLIEVFPGDEQFLSACLQKELIPLFQLGQVCGYNWGGYSRKPGTGEISQILFSL